MRKEKTFIEPFSFQSRYAKRSSVAYLRPSQSHPLSLATETCPPFPPTIDRITKQRYKPEAEPKNHEQKRKKRKPMHKRTKNETKRKKIIKITTCMLFFIFIKAHIQKKHLLLLFHKWPAKAVKMTH